MNAELDPAAGNTSSKSNLGFEIGDMVEIWTSGKMVCPTAQIADIDTSSIPGQVTIVVRVQCCDLDNEFVRVGNGWKFLFDGPYVPKKQGCISCYCVHFPTYEIRRPS